MRKAIIIIMLLISVFSLSAIKTEEAIWYQNATRDALNVFDLESVFYLPKRGSTWNSNSASTGTINSSNYIGHLGVKYCEHNIKFSVSTTGKFVSQSDPTKYREFCIAMCPRYEKSNIFGANQGDAGYFWDVETNSAINGNDRAVNTKDTGYAYVISPTTDGSRVYVARNTRAYVWVYWVDLVVIMDELDSDDLQHLEENDDYMAHVTLSWECYSDSGCTDGHSGSYTFALRGYYGSAGSSDQDAVYFFVTPTTDASNLDIKTMLQDNSEVEIADIQIHTTTRTDTSRYSLSSGWCPGYAWADHVFGFVSASSDYLTSNSDGFLLVNQRYGSSTTIPFEINIYDSDGTLNQSFDGTDYYHGSTTDEKKAYCVDISDVYTSSSDRNGNTFYAVNYFGDVKVQLLDPSGAALTNADNAYSGLYTSTIYYHVIYE